MLYKKIFVPLLLFLFTSSATFSANQDIIISEVQADDEFIRLSNATESPIDLTGFKLSKKALSSKVCKESAIVSEKAFVGTIGSKGTFTISHPLYKEKYNANLTYSSDSYYITDDTIILLYDTKKQLIDRKAVGNACDMVVPTPEPTPDPVQPPTASSKDIRINEVFPNPVTKGEDDEWIEFYNFGPNNIALDNFTLSDATNKPYIFPVKTTLEAKHFLLLFRKDSDIALNNTDEIVTLADASKNIVSQVSYGKTIEGASLNYAQSGYRWSKTLTPGSKNILGNAPETKEKNIPDTTYRDVLTTFSATGKDGDGDSIKYTWDFGDGHKSYKGETTHRYAKEGKYEGTLTVTDGTESVVTHFTIDVEKYEAPKVRMTTLVPNPTGRDTDAEYITLENRSRKSVDLLGWSIATGWKKLVNHPIRESFVIPKKSKRDITHAFSAFTLPNEKGRIELRSPDGETVQKMKYNLKGKSAEENARLVKEKGKKWEWIIPQLTDNSEQETSLTAVVPPAESAIINLEEEQLQKDTKIITQRKNRGEKLLSSETNAPEEMRRLISYGTDIETPAVILALAPRVAGASDEISPTEQDNPDTGSTININALINHWLSRE